MDDLTGSHPQNKKDVGVRLPCRALTRDYGRTDIEVSGPIFRSMEMSGGKVTLHFVHIGGSLACKGRALDWFFIVRTIGEFSLARAEIVGDTVVVTIPRVSAPAVKRLAWDEAPRPNFFNMAGLPTMPFRTDAPFKQAGGKAPNP